MFRNILHLSLATAFIYLCCKNAIAQEGEDEVAKQLNNETDLISPLLENLTNWLVETCSTYNTSDAPTHHRVRNMTVNATSGFDFSSADNKTVYAKETIIPMARGLLHGLIDAYADFTNGEEKKTAKDFVFPCNCTVLLTIGQLGNITTNDTRDIRSVARLVTILYETRLISLPALGDAPVPQLGIVRTFSLAQAFCLLFISGIERIFATYFVADYERKRRYYLSIIIIITMNTVAVSISYAMVTGILNGYIVCVAVIFPNFACAGMLRWMLKWNRQRLATISHVLKRSANDEYSLSLRLQLKENIWSIQKMEFGMYLLIIGLTVNLIITYCPIFVLTAPEEMETLQWCQWAANVLIAITITLCVPMGTFAIGMHTGEIPAYARIFMKIFGSKDSVEVKVEKKETDTYFGQLHSQWDLAMRRATSLMKALSTFFYPEPDFIHVQGPDNSSYWVILFVKSDQILDWKVLYYIGVIVEVIFLVLGGYLHGNSTLLIWKHKALHPNMILIYTNYYFMFNIGSMARIGIILFETRLIFVEYLGSIPVPQLGIIRLYSVIHVFCYLYFATAERVVATILVANYEKQQRHRFAIFIISFLNVSILLVSVLNGYICCFLAIIPCFGCIGVLRYLFHWNKKKLAKLSDTLKRSANDHYTLSLRMQLKENVWTIQKIEFGMYIVIVCMIVNLAVILIPIFVLSDPEDMETLQWWQWSANISIAVFITCSVPMGTFAVAMHTGNLPVYARWYLKLFGQNEAVVVKTEKKETDEHFHQLHNQWDLAMRSDRKW